MVPANRAEVTQSAGYTSQPGVGALGEIWAHFPYLAARKQVHVKDARALSRKEKALTLESTWGHPSRPL